MNGFQRGAGAPSDASATHPWDAELFLRFEAERAWPARDLVARIDAAPRLAFDLGCGPGTSTRLLRERFPEARISGVDTSEPMLAEARRRLPGVEFEQADIAHWRPRRPPDLIFADSALQWVADHETLVPAPDGPARRGGTLAVQMPDNRQEPSHALMRLIAADGPWADRLVPIAKTRAVIATHVDYYNWLRPLSASLEIWQTTYVHPLAGVDAVVDWFRGSALLPFLAPLAPQRARGIPARATVANCSRPMASEPDGQVLFLYPRLFILARKAGSCARECSAQARRCPAGRAGPVRQPRAGAGGDRRRSRARRRRSSCARPRDALSPEAAIEASAAHPWASRGGLKLAAALDAFALDPAGLACLDVGASTGGFTDVLLSARRALRRRGRRRPRPVRRPARRRSARALARRL